MSDNGKNQSDFGANFVGMWSDMAAKMMQAGMAFTPENSFADSMKQMRSTMLDTWAKSWDEFLRSPEFLKMMKQSLPGSIQGRKQFNDFAAELQNQFQMPSLQDVDQVLRGLGHLEQRMVQLIEGLADSVQEIRDRVDAMAPQTDPAPESETGAPRRPVRRPKGRK